MSNQGVKTINAEFIWTHALLQLSFVQFRPDATSFLGLLLTLTLMWKSKKTLEKSFDLIPLFKTTIDARGEDCVSNVDCLENWCHSFIQNKYGRKRGLPCTHVLFFLFGLFSPFMTPRIKKRINKALSMQSKQFLLHFYFLIFWFLRIEFQNSI